MASPRQRPGDAPTARDDAWIPTWDGLVEAVEAERPRFVLIAGDLLPKHGGVPAQAAFFADLRRHLTAMARHAPVSVLTYLGNDDAHILEPHLDRLEAEGLCINLNGRIHREAGLVFCGMNRVRDYPFGYKHWCASDGEYVACPEQYCGQGMTLDQHGNWVHLDDLVAYLTLECPMAERFKDRFFQRPYFERLADEVVKTHPSFDRELFFGLLYDKTWSALELKARMRHASEALGQTLPDDYRTAIAILLKVERHFDGFDHLLFADYVERFGVDDFDASMPALEVFTRTSAEFAVRPFIRRYPERAFAQLLAWTGHESDKVRRLASEGCRPRLPWGTALEELKADPTPILSILERLKDDPSDFVRRSVANNIGDIAKDHPGLAVSIGERWMAESQSRTALMKHALRDLLKKGNRRALHLFGVGAGAAVELDRLSVTPTRVPLGGTATLRVVLRSTRKRPQRLRLEYAMVYARPGGRTGKKMFKIADVTIAAGAPLELSRKINFADRSIRRHYAGRHTATLVVNGHALGTATFTLA